MRWNTAALFSLLASSVPTGTSAFLPPTTQKRAAISSSSSTFGTKITPLATTLQTSLTTDQEHALEVFNAVARRRIFQTDTDDIDDEFMPYPLPTIDEEQLGEMLQALRIEATEDEAYALFKYLDEDGDGQVSFDEFLPWYDASAEAAKSISANFQELLLGRRTVDQFDATPVDDDVLERAIACAIAAPNRSGSEPWRFSQVGPETVKKLADLRTAQLQMEESRGRNVAFTDSWTQIPGWVVVTSKVTPDDPVVELEDYKSTACAVQNLMLSLWSEGVGSKWTSGPIQRTEEFAKVCGVDTKTEKIVGVIWFGFPTGGFANAADPKRRKKGVFDVLSRLP